MKGKSSLVISVIGVIELIYYFIKGSVNTSIIGFNVDKVVFLIFWFSVVFFFGYSFYDKNRV